MTTTQPPLQILTSYCQTPPEAQIAVLGEGHINKTFLVQCGEQSFILQRINDQVFPAPHILISNMLHFSHHLQTRQNNNDQYWQEAHLLPAHNGEFSQTDNDGRVWRAMTYIKNSQTLTHVENSSQAEQAGRVLGRFHTLTADLDTSKLKMPLPGFHDTAGYLQHYDLICTPPADSDKISLCRDIIREMRKKMQILSQAREKGIIRERVIHGDPKVSNILFDRAGKHAIAIIDLDTIGPGLLQHDIGDFLRSVCNPLGEDNLGDEILFDTVLCRRALEGYFRETGDTIPIAERRLFYEGIITITFELGLRFFTDFLQGGVYFKSMTNEEILQKAVIQFLLLRSILSQEEKIRTIIG